MFPEKLMPELNRRVRHAVLTSVYTLLHSDRPGCLRALGNAASGIPKYWEVVELLPEELAVLDADKESIKLYEARNRVKEKREAWFKTGRCNGPKASGE
jgi:hypothetical protein